MSVYGPFLDHKLCPDGGEGKLCEVHEEAQAQAEAFARFYNDTDNPRFFKRAMTAKHPEFWKKRWKNKNLNGFPDFHLPSLLAFVSQSAVTFAQRCLLSESVSEPFVCPYPVVMYVIPVLWGGEQMLEIGFEPLSVPKGPAGVRVYFPRGRPRLTTEAYVGMAHCAMRAGVPQARVINYVSVVPNPVCAEFVLMELILGQSLDQAWPSLSAPQRSSVCTKLAKCLMQMFTMRSDHIHSAMLNGDASDAGNPEYKTSYLLSRPFDQGPLRSMNPSNVPITVPHYLSNLVQRIERFTDPEPTDEQRAQMCWPGKASLSDAEISLIQETWRHLKLLLPYHTGGFFIPPSIPKEQHDHLLKVVRNHQRVMYHSDLRMERLVLWAKTPGEEPTLYVTGWEHAYFAPLWSACRMPGWLCPKVPHPVPLPLPPKEQSEYQWLVYKQMRDFSSDWALVYAFCETERFFEGCASAHWSCRDAVELGIRRIKKRWQALRPDVSFPISIEDDFERLLPATSKQSRSTRRAKRSTKQKVLRTPESATEVKSIMVQHLSHRSRAARPGCTLFKLAKETVPLPPSQDIPRSILSELQKTSRGAQELLPQFTLFLPPEEPHRDSPKRRNLLPVTNQGNGCKAFDIGNNGVAHAAEHQWFIEVQKAIGAWRSEHDWPTSPDPLGILGQVPNGRFSDIDGISLMYKVSCLKEALQNLQDSKMVDID